MLRWPSNVQHSGENLIPQITGRVVCFVQAGQVFMQRSLRQTAWCSPRCSLPAVGYLARSIDWVTGERLWSLSFQHGMRQG